MRSAHAPLTNHIAPMIHRQRVYAQVLSTMRNTEMFRARRASPRCNISQSDATMPALTERHYAFATFDAMLCHGDNIVYDATRADAAPPRCAALRFFFSPASLLFSMLAPCLLSPRHYC